MEVCNMGDSNKVLESGTGKTEEHDPENKATSLIDLTKDTLKPKLNLQ